MNEVKWSVTSQTIIIWMELIRSFINDSTENVEDLDDSFVRIQRFHCFKDVEQWLVPLVQTKIDRFKHFIQYKAHQLLLVTLIVAVARLIFYCVIWVENTDNTVFHRQPGSSMKLDGTLFNLLSMKLHYPETTTPCYKWNLGEANIT